MLQRLGLLLLLSLAALATQSAQAFQQPGGFLPPKNALAATSRAQVRKALMRREVVPQIIFAAACAGAVVGYVATHIDEIKEKQRVAVERTMTKQADDIKSAQQQQQEAIQRALKKQQDEIKRIQDQQKR